MRILKLAVVLSLIAALLCGGGIEMISMPKLPELNLGKSELTGTVEYINGRTCRVLITEGDSHFDEEDIIQVTYVNLVGSKAVSVGSTVSFSYDYTSQVAEHLGSPHITVHQVHVG